MALPEEEFDDHEAVGADPAEVEERREAMRQNSVDGGGEGGGPDGRGNLSSVSGSGDEYSPSGLQKDSAPTRLRVLPGGKKDDNSLVPETSSQGSQNFGQRISGNLLKRKKLLIGLGAGAGIAGIFGILIFPLIIAYQIIHIRENIVQYIDKRTEHTVANRMGKTWKLVLDKDGNPSYYKKYSANPLTQKVSSIKSEKLAAKLEAANIHATLTDGKLTRLTYNGEVISTSDDRISDRRSAIRGGLKNAFPEMNAFRRGLLAKKTYAHYGVKLKVFENTRENIKDWNIEWRRRMRERLFGADSKPYTVSGDRNTANDTGKTEAQKQQESGETKKFSQDIQDQADAIRQDALDHPDKVGFNPPTLGDVSGAGLKGAFKGALGGAVAILSDACQIKALLALIQGSAEVMRAAPLAKQAGTIVVAADQLKRGDSVDSHQVGALVKSLDGFEKSGAWQRITGTNPNADIKTGDRFRVDGAKVGSLEKINNYLSVPGSGITCSVANNPFVQIAAGAVNLIADGLSGGTTIAAQAGVAASVATAQQVLTPVAVEMVAGMTVTGDEPGDQKIDATVAGYDVISNSTARAYGGRKLKPAEVALADQQSNLEDYQENQNRSFIARVIDTDDSKSLVNRIAMAAPTSYSESLDDGTQVASILAPSDFFKQGASFFKGIFSGQSTFAADTSRNWFGVDQYGLTDQEMDQYPDILANEDVVMQHKADFDDFVSKCLDPDADPEQLNQDPCTNTDDLHTRYRVYQFDSNLIDNLAGYIDPTANEAVSAATPDANGGSVPSGSAQDLGKQIVQLHNQGKITYALDTAAIDANFKAIANGGKPQVDTGRKVTPDPRILAALVYLASKGTVQVNSYTDGGHHTAPTNPHGEGKAMDIGAFNGKTLGSGDRATTEEVEKYLSDVLPARSRFGADFYSDSTWSTPATVNGKQYLTGNDTPGHLHYDVHNVSGN